MYRGKTFLSTAKFPAQEANSMRHVQYRPGACRQSLPAPPRLTPVFHLVAEERSSRYIPVSLLSKLEAERRFEWPRRRGKLAANVTYGVFFPLPEIQFCREPLRVSSQSSDCHTVTASGLLAVSRIRCITIIAQALLLSSNFTPFFQTKKQLS